MASQGYSTAHISAALHQLRAAAQQHSQTLAAANEAVYALLRYGVTVRLAPGAPKETVHLVDWAHPEANDFAIAEEVTLKGGLERRPDLVLYLNGLPVVRTEITVTNTTVPPQLLLDPASGSRQE